MLLIPSLVLQASPRVDDLLQAVRSYEELGATWLYVFDEEGERAGAPQNIEATHQTISGTRARVIFEGGVRLMHVAQMLLGLGVERVVISPRWVHTEAAAASMFARLGDRAAARAFSAAEARRLVAMGASRIVHTLRELADPEASMAQVRGFAEVGAPVMLVVGANMLEDECNGRLLACVGIEAVVLRGEPCEVARVLVDEQKWTR